MALPMTLDIWAGDWGLASVDVDCLRFLAYSRFCGAKVEERVVRTPYFSPNGKLPVFRHGSATHTKFDDLVAHLHKKNFSADVHLEDTQKCEAHSYACYLEEKLSPALLHMWWVNEKNYLEFSRPWFAGALRLPFNFFYPGHYMREAKKRIESCFHGSPDEIETQILNEAEQCLSGLSKKLGDNDYFMGKRPCSLDATVFAYLAPLLKVPLPSARLQNHLKMHQNLVRFVARVDQSYFASSFSSYQNQKKAEAAKEENEEFPNQRRNWLFAGIFATAAMTGYLFSQGMLQISLRPQTSGGKRQIEDEYNEIYLSQDS